MIMLALPPLGHGGYESITSPYAPTGIIQVDRPSETVGRIVLGSEQLAS
jgi:hypothetical protein